MSIVLASLFAFVIGVAVGFITTFTHRGIPPWGLIAGLVIIAAAVLGFRLVFASRIIGAAAAAGVHRRDRRCSRCPGQAEPSSS